MTAIDLVRHLEGVDHRTACFILGCDEVRPQPIVKPKLKAAADENNNGALALDMWVATSAILVSLLLQHGVELHVIKHSISGPIAVALNLAEDHRT